MAIIQEQEFLSNLYAIQSLNPPSYVLFPDKKKTYNIDLATRTIDAPTHLSVSKDHESETIYFKIDRFHDYMDLTNTTCVIQYITPDKKAHLYAVPFYDVITDKVNNKVIFPWCVDGNATKFTGIVEFSVRFYIAESYEEIKEVYDEESDTLKEEKSLAFRLLYNLTTAPAYSKVLDGMEVSKLESDFDISASAVDYILGEISKINREGVYWDILD
jgi:hypothetical protein